MRFAILFQLKRQNSLLACKKRIFLLYSSLEFFLYELSYSDREGKIFRCKNISNCYLINCKNIMFRVMATFNCTHTFAEIVLAYFLYSFLFLTHFLYFLAFILARFNHQVSSSRRNCSFFERIEIMSDFVAARSRIKYSERDHYNPRIR